MVCPQYGWHGPKSMWERRGEEGEEPWQSIAIDSSSINSCPDFFLISSEPDWGNCSVWMPVPGWTSKYHSIRINPMTPTNIYQSDWFFESVLSYFFKYEPRSIIHLLCFSSILIVMKIFSWSTFTYIYAIIESFKTYWVALCLTSGIALNKAHFEQIFFFLPFGTYDLWCFMF